MFEATLERLQTGQKDRAMYKIPPNLQKSFWAEVKKSPQYNRVRIGKPSKPRTTGDLSQNHLISRLVNLVMEYTGDTYDSIKLQAKRNGLRRGYPYRIAQVYNPTTGLMIEQIDPYHENELDTIQAGILITELQSICIDLDIPME